MNPQNKVTHLPLLYAPSPLHDCPVGRRHEPKSADDGWVRERQSINEPSSRLRRTFQVRRKRPTLPDGVQLLSRDLFDDGHDRRPRPSGQGAFDFEGGHRLCNVCVRAGERLEGFVGEVDDEVRGE